MYLSVGREAEYERGRLFVGCSTLLVSLSRSLLISSYPSLLISLYPSLLISSYHFFCISPWLVRQGYFL